MDGWMDGWMVGNLVYGLLRQYANQLFVQNPDNHLICANAGSRSRRIAVKVVVAVDVINSFLNAKSSCPKQFSTGVNSLFGQLLLTRQWEAQESLSMEID